jgi:cell division protein FtsL
VSWPWIVLLVLAAAVVIAAEWSRVGQVVGSEARRQRERKRRKASFRVIRTEEEEFAESVQRDLAELPTIEEKDRRS